MIRGLLWASIVLGGIAGVPLALVAGTVLVGLLPVPVAQIEFDSAAWKTADPREPEYGRTRQRMMDDLLEHRLAVGMPAAEVTELLGPPTLEKQIEGHDVREYWLGPERVVMPWFDSEFLRVVVLEDGTVGGFDRFVMR